MVSTYEGIVENGRIRLRDNVSIPENTKVYVLIPAVEAAPIAQIQTPRLAHPEQASDFVKHVIDVIEP